MPRSPEQHEAMRAATRESVRSAAVRMFAQQGYAAVSMRQIAAEAGISTGLIYRHFATKDELFGGLVAEAATGLGAVAERFRGSEDPAESLRAFTEEFLADLSHEGDFAEFFLLMNHAYTQGVGEGREVPAAVRDLIGRSAELQGVTVGLIEQGQRRGVFRAGPADELAACYFAVFGGLVSMRSATGAGFAVPTTATVLSFLLREHSGDEGEQ
ncbi:TetR/AcrR family transcriptional regulator [Nocardiopsis nanhaiensis]